MAASIGIASGKVSCKERLPCVRHLFAFFAKISPLGRQWPWSCQYEPCRFHLRQALNKLGDRVIMRTTTGGAKLPSTNNALHCMDSPPGAIRCHMTSGRCSDVAENNTPIQNSELPTKPSIASQECRHCSQGRGHDNQDN